MAQQVHCSYRWVRALDPRVSWRYGYLFTALAATVASFSVGLSALVHHSHSVSTASGIISFLAFAGVTGYLLVSHICYWVACSRNHRAMNSPFGWSFLTVTEIVFALLGVWYSLREPMVALVGFLGVSTTALMIYGLVKIIHRRSVDMEAERALYSNSVTLVMYRRLQKLKTYALGTNLTAIIIACFIVAVSVHRKHMHGKDESDTLRVFSIDATAASCMLLALVHFSWLATLLYCLLRSDSHTVCCKRLSDFFDFLKFMDMEDGTMTVDSSHPLLSRFASEDDMDPFERDSNPDEEQGLRTRPTSHVSDMDLADTDSIEEDAIESQSFLTNKNLKSFISHVIVFVGLLASSEVLCAVDILTPHQDFTIVTVCTLCLTCLFGVYFTSKPMFEWYFITNTGQNTIDERVQLFARSVLMKSEYERSTRDGQSLGPGSYHSQSPEGDDDGAFDDFDRDNSSVGDDSNNSGEASGTPFEASDPPNVGGGAPYADLLPLQDTESHFVHGEFDPMPPYMRGADLGNAGTVNSAVHSDILSMLPEFEFSEDRAPPPLSPRSQQFGDDPGRVCVVCLEDYQRGEKLLTLPCFHYFHRKCIDMWMQKQSTCPICQCTIDFSGIPASFSSMAVDTSGAPATLT